MAGIDVTRTDGHLQMPTRLRGVWVIRVPTPTPVCLGVPGTIIFDLLPLDIRADSSSSAFFFATLYIYKRSQRRALFDVKDRGHTLHAGGPFQSLSLLSSKTLYRPGVYDHVHRSSSP